MHSPFTLEGANLTTVDAGELRPNDRMANLGIVETVAPITGVHVLVEYTARQWNLATGQTTYTRQQLVLHRADTVAVAR